MPYSVVMFEIEVDAEGGGSEHRHLTRGRDFLALSCAR
jgi:hypothetical protein